MIGLLLVATLAAIFVTQRLRAEGTVISDVQTSRAAFRECPVSERAVGIPISFELGRDDTVSAEIVAFDRPVTVRRLFSNRRLPGSARHCAPWDGLDELGKPAAPGRYRLKIGLADLQKAVTAGEPIRLRAGSNR